MLSWAGIVRVVVVATILTGVFAGCGLTEPASESAKKSGPRGDRPNVVLIVMDTVRADHLSCYGYDRETTPFLSELAREGRLYTDAHSTSCWTGPSHASLFTGLYPAGHGVTQTNWTLSDKWTTLAEAFGEMGYSCIGIVENAILNAERNYDQGFDVYHEAWRRKIYREAWAKRRATQSNVALDLFTDSLRSYTEEGPFFMFVNIIEAHYPYKSAGPFEGLFTGEMLTDFDWRNNFPEFVLGDVRYTEEDFRYLSGRYDEEIRYVDDVIEKMAGELKSLNLWDNTIFVVTADHGENIGDHNMMDHIFNLYESVVRVPLIVRFPKLVEPGSIENAPVQLLDLYPTLLKMAGADLSNYQVQGLDLLDGPLRGDRPVFAEYDYPKQVLSLFPEDRLDDPLLDPFKRRLRSVTENGLKFIWGSDGKHELYALESDPNELTNLIADPAHGPLRESLLRRVLELYDYYALDPGNRDAIAPELDADTREALEALGYVK